MSYVWEWIVMLQLPRRALALVLAGGRGTRLKDLTAARAKPAVPFGGKFRIIDFALSNCINSGIRRVGVITQYKSHSLLRHLQHGWAFLRAEANEFIEMLPAQQRSGEEWWYRGTADAVYQNIDILREHGADYIVVLAGDHVYKMDYAGMLAEHQASGAPCTVGTIEVASADARAFGVMTLDAHNRISAFVEKPDDPEPWRSSPGRVLASMGIYVFDAAFLFAELERDMAEPDSTHDFGRDLIPAIVARGLAGTHAFSRSCVTRDATAEPYWRDLGTVDAYWAANIDLTAASPALDIYDSQWPIWTWQEQLPPAKFVFDRDDRRGMAVDSIVASGCIVSGAHVSRSVLFPQVRVNSWSRVRSSVVLPGVDIGRHARLTNAIIDRGCRLPEGMVIGEDPEADARRFHRTSSGVTLVTQPMLEQLHA
jgi:glucose-1-phosphate adenylyltransferase